MKIHSTFLTLLLILSTGWAPAQAQTLTISTNNTPMDRRVLEQVSREAFRRIGVDFKLLSLPSERSLHSANQGEVDGEGLRVAGLSGQYPQLLQVPESYTRISFVAFSSDPAIDLSRGWESLKPHSVVFITGWKMFEAHASGARVVNKVDTPEQVFRMLQSGRVDLALYTQADGLALVKSMGFSSVALLSPPLQEVDMYLYLNQKHRALVPKLSQALRDMKADGSYRRILSNTNLP